MAVFHHLLLVLSLVPLTLSSPFYPPTCYSKVLSKARELNLRAAQLKGDPHTSYCMGNIPDLHLDVHNACVMHKMRTYIVLVEDLRHQRCSNHKEMWRLSASVRHLYMIMSQRCHGDLVFTVSDCSALER
ncbi:cytokine-like protein 1 [Genypterus blacodes]|uniref:cytokine-like protein 1 n=1 Tax=Genypterus blacodes TaxID=154954 RepID=UPI003F77028A